METLHLIKHSLPEKDPQRPSREWVLGPAGRLRALRLAERLAGAGIARFMTSGEPKAAETAEIMAVALGATVEVVEGLHEQERAGAPFFPSEAAFEAAMRDLFERPGESVFGQESADQAHARFASALGAVIARARGAEPLAVVTHGTVMSLLIARRNRLDVFALWKSLGLPSCAVLSLPDLGLREIVQTR